MNKVTFVIKETPSGGLSIECEPKAKFLLEKQSRGTLTESEDCALYLINKIVEQSKKVGSKNSDLWTPGSSL